MVGTGVTCLVVALLDDRAALPGWALAQLTLGGAVLFSMVRFSGDVDYGDAAAWLIVAYFASTLASGAYGTLLCLREAITTVLEQPDYRQVASRLAAEMAEQAPADRVLDALRLT